jgi:aminopeptidase N
MEEVSQQNLSAFFKQWLRTAGEPELQISHKKVRNKLTEISVQQKQEHLFSFDLELLIKDSSGDIVKNISVDDRVTKIMVRSGNISEIVPDPNVILLFKLQNSH